MFKQTFTPIGLDVREDAVYAIQFRATRAGAEVYAAAMLPIVQTDGLPRDAAVAQALRALPLHGFAGNAVVAAVPRTEADIRRIQMAASPERNYGQFLEEIQAKARQALLYPIEEAVLDYVPLGSFTEDQKECSMVMLIAARRAAVVRQLDLLAAAGLKCLHLDATPCAVARVFRDDVTTATIDIDYPCTVISVSQGERMLFSRTIRVGARHLVDEAAARLALDALEAHSMLRIYGIDAGLAGQPKKRCDPAEIAASGQIAEDSIPGLLFDAAHHFLVGFAREIRRSFDYVMHQNHAIFGRGPWVGGPVEKVHLVGSLLPAGLADFLSERLSLPAVCGDPFAAGVATCAGEAPACAAGYAVSAGLALRSVAA